MTGTYRYVAGLAKGSFKVEFFLLSEDAHDQERFRRRIRIQNEARTVFFPTPEDVIITKLRWSQRGKRHKDMDDVRNVIAVQGSGLDWIYIESWCDRHGTRQLLEDVRRSIPPI